MAGSFRTHVHTHRAVFRASESVLIEERVAVVVRLFLVLLLSVRLQQLTMMMCKRLPKAWRACLPFRLPEPERCCTSTACCCRAEDSVVRSSPSSYVGVGSTCDLEAQLLLLPCRAESTNYRDLFELPCEPIEDTHLVLRIALICCLEVAVARQIDLLGRVSDVERRFCRP